MLVPISSTDGNDSFTKILLHCDGVDLGLSFPDTAAGKSNSHTWANGNSVGYSDLVYTDATNPKFGTSPLFFPNTSGGSFLTCADDSDFNLGSSDLAIDFQINRGGDTGNRGLFGQANATIASGAATLALLDTAGLITWNLYASGGLAQVVSTTSINGSVYHHVECFRSGSTIGIFIDGALDATASVSGSVSDIAEPWRIGRAGDFTFSGFWANFKGRIDEFRMSVGIARHTAAFTPRALAYGPD